MQQFDYLKHISGDYDRSQVLQELMQAFGKEVWNFAFSLTYKAEDADDITQNTFMQVYRKLHTFKGESSIKTWILVIARNQAADYRRSAFLRRVMLVPQIWSRLHSKAASAEAEALEKIAANGVWEKVLRLPGKFRVVLILHTHHHLSVAEIAALLRIPEGTVKSRLSRARARVNQMLEGGD